MVLGHHGVQSAGHGQGCFVPTVETLPAHFFSNNFFFNLKKLDMVGHACKMDSWEDYEFEANLSEIKTKTAKGTKLP